MSVRIQEAASLRLDEIYRYTWDRWGEAQAERHINDMFDALGKIESHGVASRPIPAAFRVAGFYFRHAHYFVWWRRLSNGDIGVVTILHERMHQMDRFRDDPGA